MEDAGNAVEEMPVTFSGITITLNLLQFLKVLSYIFLRPFGRDMLSSEVQPENAEYSIVVKVDVRDTFLSEVQLENIEEDMLVTPSPITTSVSALQFENALLPILVTLPGIYMLLRL